MANLKIPKLKLLYAIQLLSLFQIQVHCYQFKVGNLDAWGLPPSSNPQVYFWWSKYHSVNVGDSLLFLYPPSEDSVVQVTKENYNICNTKNPILYMNDGNSVFNITTQGDFYFTSGNPGRCEKKQKLHISVNGTDSSSPDSDGSASAPSYPTVFGNIPLPPSASISATSSSSSLIKNGFSVFFVGAVAAAFTAFANGGIM